MLGTEKRANKSASLSIKDEKSRGRLFSFMATFINYQSTLILGSFDLTE